MPTGLTLSYTGELVVLTCWCGMAHGVPAELRNYQIRQHRDGERNVIGIYCPLGHSHVPSGKGRAAELEEQLERERKRAASSVAALDQERASHAATKGQLTKTRKRIANGVCPCCHRSFVNVARHMKGQHPDYAATL